MDNFLSEIIAAKNSEIVELKQKYKFNELLKLAAAKKNEKKSLVKSIGNKSFIISEFKKASPSKGDINVEANLEEVVRGYEKAGASAISILTEKNKFKGSILDLIEAKKYVSIPLLRKDFLTDLYQVAESALIGADLILLIAASLTKQKAEEMFYCAKELGMEVLLEVHDEFELEMFSDLPVDFLGVNNRNLKTLKVDIANSIKLSPLIKQYSAAKFNISESGLKSIEDLKLLKKFGYKGFLIGESFMTNEKPYEACAKLIDEINA